VRTDAVITIAGAHDARNAASRLTMPVPDGSCRADPGLAAVHLQQLDLPRAAVAHEARWYCQVVAPDLGG
jgi:hypothetical protein